MGNWCLVLSAGIKYFDGNVEVDTSLPFESRFGGLDSNITLF